MKFKTLDYMITDYLVEILIMLFLGSVTKTCPQPGDKDNVFPSNIL